MKPFDLEAAKRGEKVINREGNFPRIICFDYKSNGIENLIVLHPYINLSNKQTEASVSHYLDGRFLTNKEHEYDLFMAPKKIKLMNILMRDKKTGNYFVPHYSFLPNRNILHYVKSDDVEFVKIIEIEVDE